MHEDRLFRSHFRTLAMVENQPDNPWRLPANQQGRWQEEQRPGAASILAYAVTGCCLLACLCGQAFGWYDLALVKGTARLLNDEVLRQQVTSYIAQIPSPF